MENMLWLLNIYIVYVSILILIVLGIYDGEKNDWYVLFSIQRLIWTELMQAANE